MNKNTIIALIVAFIIIVFGVGAFLLSPNKSVKPTINQPSAAKPTTTTGNSVSSTIKELLASKTPVKCTYSTDVGTTKIEGTVYVLGGKVRGDYTTVSGKTTITGHMATDEKYVYSWTEGSKQGYKFSITDTQKTAANASSQNSQQAADLNQKFNYNCVPWSPDAKMMTLPSDVTFTTFSIPVVPTGGNAGAINNTSACAACNSLTGETKTTCLTQLKCN